MLFLRRAFIILKNNVIVELYITIGKIQTSKIKYQNRR